MSTTREGGWNQIHEDEINEAVVDLQHNQVSPSDTDVGEEQDKQPAQSGHGSTA